MSIITEVHDTMKTTYITPIVCYLCHENCDDNGSVIEVSVIIKIVSFIVTLFYTTDIWRLGIERYVIELYI